MKKIVGLLALAVVTASPAHAQTVNFTGTTLGCFYTAVVCTPVAASSLAGGGLGFQGGSFNVTTSNGFVGVGNNAMSTNNFGSFTLPANVTPQTLPASGTNFLLHVLFTAPAGITPNPVPFMATVTGSVTADAGGYFINFDNTPTNITWTGGNGTIWMNDVSIVNTVAASATAITGNITANQTTVPEPSTLLLVASGIAGLVTVSRRRRFNV